MRSAAGTLLLSAVGLAAVVHLAFAQQQKTGGDGLEIIQVQPNFYMIAGAGANIGVEIGPDGVVVVDTGRADRADAVIAAIKQLTPEPIRYIIDTSADPDHVGGNEKLAAAGRAFSVVEQGGSTSPASGNPEPRATLAPRGVGLSFEVPGALGGAPIVAHEDVLSSMSVPSKPSEKPPYPVGAWPTQTFSGRQMSLYLNHDGIQVLAQPGAHSDSFVLFRRSDVIVAGDILDTTRFPVIDSEKGGGIRGEIDALNRLIDLTVTPVPLPFQEGGTQVIPGHGRVCQQADVVAYRDMVTIVRDNVQDMIKRGMNLEQIKEADPAKAYGPRYGSKSGPWTTNMFVEAIYRSLTSKK